jgi:hypothetical protein
MSGSESRVAQFRPLPSQPEDRFAQLCDCAKNQPHRSYTFVISLIGSGYNTHIIDNSQKAFQPRTELSSGSDVVLGQMGLTLLE